MISEQTLRAMVHAIYSHDPLRGCLVGFHGNGQSRVLDYGHCFSPTSERVIVLIEEVELNDAALLEEMRRFAASQGGSPEGSPNPSLVTNRSRLGPELAGAGLSCGLTVVSAWGIVGGVAAEVPTAGASTFLIVASWTGLTMSAIQCANGLVRVAAIAGAPDDNTLQRWDSNETYTNVILVVDAIGVVTSVASLPSQVRNLYAVIVRQRAFVARGLSFEALRRMNRMERLRAIQEVFEEASRTPEGRAALIQAAREAGLGAGTLQRGTSLSVRSGNTLVKVISEETVRRLNSSLRDVIGGVGGLIASASPSRYTGSASGSLNFIINLIDAGTLAQGGST